MPSIVAATFGDPHEAYLARARLEAEGIRCSIAGEIPPFARKGRGAFPVVELVVEPQDLEAARAILGEVDRALVERATASPTCPYCRSGNVASTDFSQNFLLLVLDWFLPMSGRQRCRDCGHRWRASRRASAARGGTPHDGEHVAPEQPDP